ncbi:bifunctional proline dehydrogenase/L-glutamate gamma-semialdehyde dehydrogenase [Crateriforma conspicua]|uniref:L-glutamate gamma-semialdehyde dehydrogenase n=1 Tax=Crateriforma conspicua TaxID=2527996 RepID=A0A5C5Y2B2_9PLAN|nr:bifunctional proline dehydrogenase/L-glutamate gamma-semialdehyde dehydrogenase [Crateriforma conspicua]TWT69906.1 Bifunctional protein PutA [Crateriforma conspicua]
MPTHEPESPSTDPASDARRDAAAAIELAADLLTESRRLQTPQERRQQSELDRMIGHDGDKATLVEMTDQAFRTHTSARVADQMTHLLDLQGIPRFFNPVEQAMLKGFQAFGEYLPGVAVPLVKEKMRRETANVILPAEPDLLASHLESRQSHGVAMNVNLLGEALLGEDETRRRMQAFCDLLRMPTVQCISVKLTTLYSQVSALARDHTIRAVSNRLERLYRNANHDDGNGHRQAKFVYLDMEEYSDLYLTAEVLRTTLQRDDLESVKAGIALQAYIPDSFLVMCDLIQWSSDRVKSGGVPLTIRLVKGANLEMERVHASVSGWPLAPYTNKHDTDANYKRMLRELITAASAGHVRVGVASHNLFDVALAMIWNQSLGAADAVQFEMLEGMANHQRRALTERDASMLLYAPACRKKDFLHAITYLIRRLDENTGAENFLRHAYRLQPDTPDFKLLADRFEAALIESPSVSVQRRRTQNRCRPPTPPPVAKHWTQFANEPDTDWSLLYHGRWARETLDQWQTKCDDKAICVTPVIAGHSVAESANDDGADAQPWFTTDDVSRPGVVTCRYQKADIAAVMTAVDMASQSTWAADRSVDDRHAVLRKVAQLVRTRRGDLIGSMVAGAGKTVAEADPEVSEAVDFLEFYPLTMKAWDECPGIECRPRGVVSVITPWNFPLAIACGGISAAISAGNPVVLKPSTQTLLPAWLLCQAFWDAGVPIEALQMIVCDDDVAEECLVKNPTVDTVVLTGGTSTAMRMLDVRPDLHLLAETGGKNVTIVTAMADRDLAIKHVLHSAFGHSGQKCSATSLLLLENEVFDDPVFRETLADAVRSLPVGSAWDLHTRVTPLVDPPTEKLRRGLQELESDETWLVMSERVDGHPTLYRPGVKWNVQPGSFTHTTELFGPVLGVMRFGRLEEAIEMVRNTGYGLTSGLESLDDREIQLWRESIPAGNLYINRPTTGAIVLRQPFGGVGLSAYGPGIKAGGPNYVLALSRVNHTNDWEPTEKEADTPHQSLDPFRQWMKDNQTSESVFGSAQRLRFQRAVASQTLAHQTDFAKEHDTFQLVGQDNVRRYRPVDGMTIRIEPGDDLADAVVAISAAVCVGTPITLSLSPEMDEAARDWLESSADWLPSLIDPIEETMAQLVHRIEAGCISRLRTVSVAGESIRRACGQRFITVIAEPVVDHGRIECLRYLNEQSISHDYHRYGNLGRRSARFERGSATRSE